MSYNTAEHATKNLNQSVRGAFKDYRKRKVTVWSGGDDPVTISQDPTWSGGTRQYYTFFRRNGERYVMISRDEAGTTATRQREDGTPIMSLAGPFEETVLHSDVICVITGYFCGKTATMTIRGESSALASIIKE